MNQLTATEPKRSLGLLDATMLVVGSMIGSGIFIVSADMARTLGSPGYLLLAWLITGVVTIVAALSYGELAGMMPKAGGQYVYLREAYNPLVGFLYGWTVFMVIQTGTIAAVAVGFAKFTAVFFPALGTTNILFSLGFIKISAAQLFAISSLILLTFTNSRGLRNVKIIQTVFTSAKVIALAGLITLGFIVCFKTNVLADNFKDIWAASTTTLINGVPCIQPLSGWAILTAMGVAMVGSLFASDAWNNVTFIAGEIKNPQKNIPWSLFFGAALVTIIYILANVVYVALLPLHGSPEAADVLGRGIQFAADDRVGTAAASLIFGAPAVYIMAALIMVSTFGCNNGLILSGARLYYAMAKDDLFFKKAATLNKYSVPGFSLLLQLIWASVLCLSGTYSDLLDYTIFAALLFYILTIAGVFILRKKRPGAERPYKAFGYPWLPLLFIIVATAICIDLLVFKSRNSLPGLIIVLSGIPVYFLQRRFKKSL